MNHAIKEALKTVDDIPIGAIIVKDGEIISSAFNQREKDNIITSHAEILAINKACKKLNNWRLNECELYVTLEPCPMCAWAILQARIKTIYFGSYNHKYGALESVINLANISDYKPKIYGGIMEKECDEILNNFWNDKRN
jgi:tRNA(adenine34) deaminase